MPLFLVLAGACAWSFWAWLRSLGTARTTENMPTTRIRSAAQGYVELQGVARAGEKPLTSPMLGLPCVWWSYTIQRNSKQAGESVYETKTSTAAFSIEDATGRCLVNPFGADLKPTYTRGWRAEEPGPPPQTLPVLSGTFYWCTESVLAPGTHLYVRGEFRTERKSPQALDLMRDKLAAWKSDDSKRAVLDVNHDGRLDDTELEAARRAALLEARREASTALGTQDIVGKPADGRAFIIVPCAERVEIRRARVRAMLYLACAVLSAVVLVSMLKDL